MDFIKVRVDGVEHDAYTDFTITALDVGRIPYSWTTTMQPINHWALRNNSENPEPDIVTKIRFLKKVGKWGNVAMEVYPPQQELVDREDVYHLWEFEFPYSNKFFSVAKKALGLYNAPGVYRVDGLRVILTTLKHWREKQEKKNREMEYWATAVEFVSEDFQEHNLTALVEVNDHLDFGLL